MAFIRSQFNIVTPVLFSPFSHKFPTKLFILGLWSSLITEQYATVQLSALKLWKWIYDKIILTVWLLTSFLQGFIDYFTMSLSDELSSIRSFICWGLTTNHSVCLQQFRSRKPLHHIACYIQFNFLFSCYFNVILCIHPTCMFARDLIYLLDHRLNKMAAWVYPQQVWPASTRP